jgi:hypothetical protein
MIKKSDMTQSMEKMGQHLQLRQGVLGILDSLKPWLSPFALRTIAGLIG